MTSAIPYVWVLFLGVGWGITQPLTKIAVSTGHQHFGLIFWQLAIGAMFLGLVSLIRGRGFPTARMNWAFYLVIAMIGTIIPNTTSYQAIAVLPSGIMSILIALVPMLALPIALLAGVEKFAWLRLLGLALGLTAVMLIIGVPGALPDPAMVVWIPLGMVAPLMYAFEGTFVAKWGTGGAGPIQLLFGASLVGCVIALPLALGTGQFINPIRVWGLPEWAFVASSLIHAVVYTCFVMIIRRYGAVFSEQVAYVVTAAGVAWAIVLLGESYSGPVWIALGLMLAGMYMVRPVEAHD